MDAETQAVVCSYCKENPYLPHFPSRRYRGARFCSADCRKSYERRRDHFRGRRRVMRWLFDRPNIFESAVPPDYLKVLEGLRKSKLAERNHEHRGPYWNLTDAGRKSALFGVVHPTT